LSTEPLPTLPGGPRVRPADLHRRMEDLLQGAHIYRAARGVHSSALATPRKILRIAEDIGKYNTLDKLRGWNALRGRPRATLLLTTGRLTAGMVSKGLRMGTPILATIGGTTAEGVRLARDHNATLVGYLRGDSMNIYSHPGRIGPPRGAGKGHG
ncbi:MAG: formate dehydrogenase accessory sulfurtransferase FdhD, partial [Euryarchaeota archaeon]|nr:formate dehydrogenase accessory sulfurtransferase FdhD [Euryarchaeota archaeon]